MKESIESVKGTQNVFFVGAGISANPPTGFPTAGAILVQLLRAITPDKETLKELLLLANADRSNKRNPGDHIRFEILLDSIQRFADPGLSILKMVDIFDEPNPIHFFLAQRAMVGDIVITTNFDSLIEEAIHRLGGRPFTICRLSEYATWKHISSSKKVPVFKLHGSYRQYDGQMRYIVSDTVQATLSAVTSGATQLILPEAKRDFLFEITRKRQIIVAGYSGGDDLDIIPTFHLLEPSSILWLIHNDASAEPFDVTEQMLFLLKSKTPESMTMRELYFKSQLFKEPTQLRIYKVNTPTFIRTLFGNRFIAAADSYVGDSPEAKLENFISNWQKRCLERDNVKYAIIGDIMMSLSRFQEAYRNFINARTACNPASLLKDLIHADYLISRAAVELCLYEEAEKWIKEAVKNLADDVGPRITALCLHQYGYVQYKHGNPNGALKWYEKSATFCKTHSLDTCLSYDLHDMALIYQDKSEYQKAIALYEESIALSSKTGDIQHFAWSLHQLGTLYYDLGLFSKARDFHFQASRIAAMIGDYAQISNSEHELGLLDFLSGNVLSSIKHFRKSISIDTHTGRTEFTPMDWQHIAIGFMECGKLKVAVKYFTKAREGYEATGDKFTLSELFAYLAQYYLEVQNFETALEKARISVELAEASGVRDFIARAKYMVGLASYKGGNKDFGSALMSEAILMAKEYNIMALILDQIYLCARFKVTSRNLPELLELTKWAMLIYLELGNSNRYAMTKTLFDRLRGNDIKKWE